MMKLEDCRREIDRINRRMLGDFVDRMRAAEGIAEYKKEMGLPVLDPARERDILAGVAESVPPELSGYARSFFASLMEVSRAYQSRLIADVGTMSREIREAIQKTPSDFPTTGKVACQGVEGAYSQIACDRFFGGERIVYFKSFDGVFSAVQSGLCDYGVLPIENSTHGSVSEVYDLMRKHRFHIVRSMKLKVDHALLAPKGATLSDIREIRSHSQALGQCSRFFDAHPEIRAVPAENTAVAAKEVASLGRRDTAVIASPSCARLYGLSPIDAEIQNNQSNFTRFICIARDTLVYPGARRISLLLTLPHTPGSLHGVLSRFAVGGFNLMKLESRPIEGSDFSFRFYLDFETPSTEAVFSLLDELEESALEVTLLGFYPEL